MITGLKKRAMHRSKILDGQLKGLQKMIDNEEYCIDILTQGLAIQKSIASLNKLILENHLRTHIHDSIIEQGSKEEASKIINELLDLYELNNIRGK